MTTYATLPSELYFCHNCATQIHQRKRGVYCDPCARLAVKAFFLVSKERGLDLEMPAWVDDITLPIPDLKHEDFRERKELEWPS